MTTKPPLTGWIFTDAVNQRDCPKCGQTAGDHCKQPKGRRAWPPHTERCLLLDVKQST